jgi:hypothetical protein
MGFIASLSSVSATKRATERAQSLVSIGKSFNLEGPYDFALISKWMKDSHQALAPLPEEQDEFDLFCLSSYAFPKSRVEWGLQILEQALHKLTSGERSSSHAPIQEEPVCRKTGT